MESVLMAAECWTGHQFGWSRDSTIQTNLGQVHLCAWPMSKLCLIILQYLLNTCIFIQWYTIYISFSRAFPEICVSVGLPASVTSCQGPSLTVTGLTAVCLNLTDSCLRPVLDLPCLPMSPGSLGPSEIWCPFLHFLDQIPCSCIVKLRSNKWNLNIGATEGDGRWRQWEVGPTTSDLKLLVGDLLKCVSHRYMIQKVYHTHTFDSRKYAGFLLAKDRRMYLL